MAIFNSGGIMGMPPAVFEVPGKIYIFGQAHDAETLTPIFGEILRGVNTNAIQTYYMGTQFTKPMFSLSGRHTFATYFGIPNTYQYTYDPNKVSSGFSYDMYTSITMPSGDVITLATIPGDSNAGAVNKYTPDGELLSSVSLPVTTYATNLYFFFENATHAFVTGSRPAGDTAAASGVIPIFSVNKNTLALTVLNSVVQSAVIPQAIDQAGDCYVVRQSYNTLTGVKISPDGILSKGSDFSTQASNGGTQIVPIYELVHTGNTIFLRDDGEFIYFTITRTVGNVAASALTTISEGKFFRIMKMRKDTLEISPASTIDSIENPNSVNIADFAAKVISVGSGVHLSFVKLEEEADGSTIIMVTGMSPSMTTSLQPRQATSASIIIRISRTFDSITVLDMFTHRSAAVPTSITVLDDDRTQFAFNYDSAGIDFVQFSRASKRLVLRDSLGVFSGSMMVDQMGRIWVLDSTTCALHLISPTLTATLRVGFTDKKLKYNGIDVQSTIAVAAFNHLGDRVANNVTLTLEGTSAVFMDGEKTYTVMTDLAEDVMVPFKLVSNGYTRVSAVVAV